MDIAVTPEPVLIPNWRAVLKRAWSVHLLILAAVLSGLEVILPLLDLEFGPRWLLPVAFFVVTGGAFVARILAQRNLTRGC